MPDPMFKPLPREDDPLYDKVELDSKPPKSRAVVEGIPEASLDEPKLLFVEIGETADDNC